MKIDTYYEASAGPDEGKDQQYFDGLLSSIRQGLENSQSSRPLVNFYFHRVHPHFSPEQMRSFFVEAMMADEWFQNNAIMVLASHSFGENSLSVGLERDAEFWQGDIGRTHLHAQDVTCMKVAEYHGMIMMAVDDHNETMQ